MTGTNNVCEYSVVILAALASLLTCTQGLVLEFSVEPTDTVVEAGQSAVLDCVVKASHPSSVLIQWLDQDLQKLSYLGDLYRSQLTNGSLYVNSVLEEQGLTGSYQCMATLPNVGSIVSRKAKLEVARISGFVEEPRDISVFVGQKAHFACHAISSPPTKVRWLKDERPLQLDELRMTVLLSGALEIDEVLESDQGTYRCNASGLNIYRLSNKATLYVDGDHDKAFQLAPPVFIARPTSAVVVEGQNVSLDCAANGYPRPTVTWLKDGRIIDMTFLDSRFSKIGSTNSLRITGIKEEDAGTYQCRAENKEDSLDASATIQVQVPPKFLKKPQDKTETARKDIELECSVYGQPEPKISWFKNGEVITSNDYYQIVNGHNLKVIGLIPTDSGIFQCFASNPAGNIQAAASVKVIYDTQPTKKRKPGRKKVKKDTPQKPLDKIQSITLFSHLKPEKSAKLGEVDFGHLRRNYMQDSSSTSQNMYDPHRAFTSLKSSESSDSINLGDTQHAFSPTSSTPFVAESSSRTGEGLPGPPRDLKAPVVKARFVALSWKPPLVNSDNIHTYTVYYRQEGSERWRVQNTSRSRLEEINIGGLTPSRVYHFNVVAINPNGTGASSESLTVTTQAEEHVASAPTQFTAYATSPRNIFLTWKPPETPNGQIERYIVYYMETSASVEHKVEIEELKYSLGGLSVFTEYSVWVVAVNENGPGAATEEKIVRTLSTAPSEPPSNVTLEPSSTSVIVRWEPPPKDSQNGVITGYKLRYRKSKKGTTVTTPANERWYLLKDLEKGSEYQVRLWAINVNGTSPPTEWIPVETYENDLDESRVPDEPGPLRVRASANRLYVMWTPPENQNIRVRNYILGWGKGIPDMYTEKLDEKTRNFIIEKLEANSEYVLSLRAMNEMGAGRPVYTTVRTQDELPPEPTPPLTPPVGLKAQILGATSVVVYWTDTTLNKSQYVRDNRYYVVKCTAEKTQKTRYVNVTDLNVMIDDLKPNTMYEFAVKLVKGRKESPWSMVVQNATSELAPNAAPRDLDVHLKEDESEFVELTWQPPKTTTGRITGYVILYTDNKTKSDREWSPQATKGDKHSAIIKDLQPSTEYYFKVQARNSKGYGPFSNVVIFTTGPNVGSSAVSAGQHLDGKGLFSRTVILYLLIGGCVIAVTTTAVVTAVLCCRRRDNTASPDRSKKGYQKGTQNVKPPDLWIHHDQMELKAIEKNQQNTDGASSSGAMTLPRSIGGNQYDNHEDGMHTNSLDQRTYVPNYMGVSSDDKVKRPVRSKPIISLPVDSKPPREPIATPINTTSLSQSSSDSTPSSRPPYPRTQYNVPRAHVTVDTSSLTNPPSESPYALHPPSWPDSNSSQPPAGGAHVTAAPTYAPGLSALGDKRAAAQGHPLKSFTVPAPPPISAPGTPQPKHIDKNMIAVRPNSSPFKKPPTSGPNTLTGTPPSRIHPTHPPPHTAEEVQRLQPSHSTEELNQEMANLEGLMLTLSTITANQFEC